MRAITFRTREILRLLQRPPGALAATRRLCRVRLPAAAVVQPLAGRDYRWRESERGVWSPVGDRGALEALGAPTRLRCPYGRVGDRLVALEPHHVDPFRFHVVQGDHGPRALPGRPRPAARMERKDARLHVVVDSVRLERLGEASTYDAHLELGTPIGTLDPFRAWWRLELGGLYTPDTWTWVVWFRYEPLRGGIAPAITLDAPAPGPGLWDALPRAHLYPEDALRMPREDGGSCSPRERGGS